MIEEIEKLLDKYNKSHYIYPRGLNEKGEQLFTFMLRSKNKNWTMYESKYQFTDTPSNAMNNIKNWLNIRK